jgi:hypothetical protein
VLIGKTNLSPNVLSSQMLQVVRDMLPRKTTCKGDAVSTCTGEKRGGRTGRIISAIKNPMTAV